MNEPTQKPIAHDNTPIKKENPPKSEYTGYKTIKEIKDRNRNKRIRAYTYGGRTGKMRSTLDSMMDVDINIDFLDDLENIL